MRPKIGIGTSAAASSFIPGTAAATVARIDQAAPARVGTGRHVNEQGEVAFDESGKAVRMTGTVLDITERKQAEEALRQSEERFRDFAEGASDWVWELDAGLRFTYVSPSFTRYSGIPIEGVVGLTRDEVYADAIARFDPEDRDGFEEFNRRLERRETFRNFRHTWVRADGEVRHFQSSAKPVFDKEGQFIGYRGVASDVTEATLRQRAIQEDLERLVEARTAELRAAQEELLRQSRLAALGQLTGTVSHELRNPLGALRTSIAAIKKVTSGESATLNRSIAIADRSVSRCDEIISDLLEYSRVRPLNQQEVNLDGWLASVLGEFELPEEVVLVPDLACAHALWIDAERLRRVVVNVVDNAVQAMTAKDEDAPEPIEKRAARLAVSTRLMGARAELRIADTGPGMDEQTRQKIFEPLFSTKAFGVGLGLTVVHQIMEQHGGGIEIASSPGQGTEVVIWLPLPEPARRAAS
jgi:PAS domain S-box-containing protein